MSGAPAPHPPAPPAGCYYGPTGLLVCPTPAPTVVLPPCPLPEGVYGCCSITLGDGTATGICIDPGPGSVPNNVPALDVWAAVGLGLALVFVAVRRIG